MIKPKDWNDLQIDQWEAENMRDTKQVNQGFWDSKFEFDMLDYVHDQEDKQLEGYIQKHPDEEKASSVGEVLANPKTPQVKRIIVNK